MLDVLVQLGVNVVGCFVGTVLGGLFLDYIRNRNVKRQKLRADCPK